MYKRNKHIGEEIKNIRKSLGYTQAELAEATGVSDRTIIRIENNPSPKRNETYKAICKKLCIPLEKDNTIKELEFNKNENYLHPTEMISKLDIENLQYLYFELGNKLMDAYKLVQEKNFKEALDIYKAFSMILPREYIYIACADMYYMLGKYKRAISYSEKALLMNKDNYEALMIKAISLGELKEYTESKLYFAKLFELYLEDYVDKYNEFENDFVLLNMAHKKTEIIKYEYRKDHIILSIRDKSYKINLKTDDSFIFIGAVPISDTTNTLMYPTLGKVFKSKQEFDDTIEQIKSKVELMQYFDKPVYLNFEGEIHTNIVERKKDVLMEIVFGDEYKIVGITDTKGDGFKMFTKLFKKYGQFRIHLEFKEEVFIIEALNDIDLKLM